MHDKLNIKIIDGYPSIPLTKIQGNIIGEAKFNEPIFSKNKKLDNTIKVNVFLYPSKITLNNGNIFQCVRFGEMNILRYVPINELHDIRYYDS